MFSRLAVRIPKSSSLASAVSAPLRKAAIPAIANAAVRRYSDDANASTTAGATSGQTANQYAFRHIRVGEGDRPSNNASGSAVSKNFPASNILYFGNLEYNVTPEDLTAFAETVAPTITAKLIYDARGMSRGYGYVEFPDVESATRVKETLNQAEFMGRRAVVNFAAPKAARIKIPESNCLYIGNLAYEIQDSDLIEIFKDIKNCVDVRVAMDRRTGQPRGFAHAEFVDTESAVRAMEQLQKVVVYGRRLRLDFAAPREMKAQLAGREHPQEPVAVKPSLPVDSHPAEGSSDPSAASFSDGSKLPSQ